VVAKTGPDLRHAETPEGDQLPILNVFVRDGEIRHAWATELMFAPGEEGEGARHLDAICPIWNVLDMTPGGRGTGEDFLNPGVAAVVLGPQTRDRRGVIIVPVSVRDDSGRRGVAVPAGTGGPDHDSVVVCDE
jgi:hypothetical protein